MIYVTLAIICLSSVNCATLLQRSNDYTVPLESENNYSPCCGFPLIGCNCCSDCPTYEPVKRIGEKSHLMCFIYHDARAPWSYTQYLDRKTYCPPGYSCMVNSAEARPKEFLHMAAIGFREQNITWLCGGSLISTNFVLTAAHCTHTRSYGTARWVRLGDLDLKNTTEDANPRDIRIVTIYKHRKYNSSSNHNDIALLRLEAEIIFNEYVRPACLHTEKEVVHTLEATGWGATKWRGKSSDILMKANLTVVDHETCEKKYAQHNKTILDNYQICAGDSSGKDTCQGDSGGPLHYRLPQNGVIEEHFVVAGVTSFGYKCGGPNSTGVYTRVSAYIDWIEDIVWP